jgi:hypothetical protein
VPFGGERNRHRLGGADEVDAEVRDRLQAAHEWDFRRGKESAHLRRGGVSA